MGLHEKRTVIRMLPHTEIKNVKQTVFRYNRSLWCRNPFSLHKYFVEIKIDSDFEKGSYKRRITRPVYLYFSKKYAHEEKQYDGF